MNRVDARGLSCPEPVLLTKNVMKQFADEGFIVEVSGETARDNVLSFCQGKKRKAEAQAFEDGWRIVVEER